MRFTSVALLTATICCCFMLRVSAEQNLRAEERTTDISREFVESDEEATAAHSRQKRTLLLKKKLLGAGLLGFGLGIAKGYKAGYYSTPEVRHVYVSGPPPPTKYIEYVEHPVYVEKIVERPIFKPVHVDYQTLRSVKDSSSPASAYGTW